MFFRPVTPAPARQIKRRLASLTRNTFAIAAAVAVAAGGFIASPAMAATSSSTGIFADDLRPRIAAISDNRPVELGVSFTPQTSGSVTAVQYYQGPQETGVTQATVWTSGGRALATVDFRSTTKEGWRTIPLASPVALQQGRTYVVSYHTPRGTYPVIERDLSRERSQNGFTLPANAGVYRYGASAFPQNSYGGSNYLVDIVYTPTSGNSAPTQPAPTTAPTPRPTTPPQATPTAAPVPQPTPSAPTPSTPPAGSSSAGWTVNENTVGLAPHGLSCESLPAYTGSSTVPRGTTISGKRVTTNLDVSAGGITIERSCIQPSRAWRGLPIVSTQNNQTFTVAPEKVVIRDSELDGSLLDQESAAWATGVMGNADVISTYIHGFGSGIAIMNSGRQLDVLIERNYVTDLIAWGNAATTGNHTDGFTIRDFSAAERADRQLVVRNNRFGSDSGNDTGAFFIQAYSGRIDNVTVEGNLLEGKGYQLALESKNYGYSNVRAMNNRFTGTGFGPAYVTGGSGWQQWQDNYIYSASAADGKGRLVSKP